MKRFSHSIYLTAFLMTMLVFTACEQFGITKSSTVNEKILTGVNLITEIRNNADIALAAKQISAEDAQNVQNQANLAREGLVVARAYSKDDVSAANAKIDAQRVILNELKRYLLSKGAGK